MWRTPKKYVVFSRDDLYEVLTCNEKVSTVDNIKLCIMADLIEDGLSLNDIILILDRYGLDYHARRAVIELKASMNLRHELPEEIAFVTCWAKEEYNCWEKNFSTEA